MNFTSVMARDRWPGCCARLYYTWGCIITRDYTMANAMKVTFLGTCSGGGPSESRNCRIDCCLCTQALISNR